MARRGNRGGADGPARSSDAVAAATPGWPGSWPAPSATRSASPGGSRTPGAPAAGGARGGARAGAPAALLIINTKSGPANNFIGRVRDVVGLLAAQGIAAEVRVKLRKKQARAKARRAARAGVPLVVATGSDGTVEAVAAGLVGSDAVLGIVPLGTCNNVTACLGLPFDPAEACALIGAGPVRRIDVGRVTARGKQGKQRPGSSSSWPRRG